MRIRALFGLLVFALAAPVAAQLNPNRPPNTIIVTAKPMQGRFNGLVKIELFRGDLPLHEDYVDARGVKQYFNLEDATYVIRLSAQGFQTQTEETMLSGGTIRNLTILLRPEAVADPGPPPSGETVPVRWLAAPENARKEVLKARELMAQQEYRQASSHLQKALRLHPGFAIANTELAVCYWRQGKVAQAHQQLDEAIRDDPAYLDAYLHKSEIFFEQKEFNQAGQVLLQATRALPDRGEPYFNMARIQYEAGHLERAEQAGRLALERNHSRIPEVHMLLVNIYVQRGETERAVAELKAYLTKAPEGTYADQARQALEKLDQGTTAVPRL